MQSIALTESSMVHDSEYVIVQSEDMDLDDASYDDCDAELEIRLSPLPSVCSEEYVPNDLEALIEDSVTASIVSLEDVEDCKEKGDDGEAPMETEEVEDSGTQGNSGSSLSAHETTTNAKDEAAVEEPTLKSNKNVTANQPTTFGAPGVAGNRLSNKKKRKKMKMMKKAAAAAAAAAALAEMNKSSIPPTSPVRSVQQSRQKPRKASSTRSNRSKQQSHANNIAVACATESLESFRKDHNLKAKKTAPNYVSLL